MEIQSTSEMAPYFTMTKCNKLFITYLTRSTERLPSLPSSISIISTISSSRISCLGGKNSLESLTIPTFVGTLYWHVINLFTDFYGKEQTLSFEGNAGVSKPDVDPDQAEAEWKIFRRILFTQHRSESGLQKIVTTFLASSALVPISLVFDFFSPSNN